MLCSSPCWALSQRIDEAKPSLKTSGQHLGDQTHNLKAALGWFDCLMFYLWLCKDPRRTCNLHRKILQHQRFVLLLQWKFHLIQEGATGTKRHGYMFQYFESWMSLAADVQKLLASLLIWRYLTLLFLVRKSCQFPTLSGPFMRGVAQSWQLITRTLTVWQPV